ncbi:MAG: TonB-dependent receptor [Pseudomonadales bacterium]
MSAAVQNNKVHKFSAKYLILLLVSTTVLPTQVWSAEPAAIEEIIVTARKREERLIDVPVSAAVLTAEEIDRYRTRDLAELTQRIPGVQITHAAGGGQGGNISIRGVGNLAVDYGTDQPVSLVLDGMSFQRSHVLDVGFFDLQTVEVLKGPQSLYFGKNSPAGVIGVTSKSPTIGADAEGFVRASYEFEAEDPVFEAGISFPLGDTLAMRIAGRYQDMDGGWLDNSARVIDNSLPDGAVGITQYSTPLPVRGPSHDKYPGQEQTVVRWTTVWQPTESFEANLKLFYSESEQNDAGVTILYACADGVGSNPYYGAGPFLWPDVSQTCTNSPRLERNSALPPADIANAHPFIDESDRFFNRVENDIYTLELNWDVGDYQLTSLSSYWDYKHREYTNYDYTSFAVVVSEQGESGDSFTQEFRIQSNYDGKFNFMAGVFYEDLFRDLDAPVQILTENLSNAFGASVPATNAPAPYTGSYINYHQHWDNDVETISVFGSIDYQINEKWEISGGLRYTEEEREAVGGNLFENSGALGFGPVGLVYTPSDESDNLSPELTVSYHPRENMMLYAAYKAGFQSAGISNPGTVPNLAALPIDVANDTLVFDETTVDGFELGMKGRFMDGRLSAEIIGFYFESEDLQVGIFNSNTTSFTLQNAAVAINYGVESNLIYQVSDALQLRAALSYAYLEFDEWEDAGCHPVDGALPDLATRTGPGCHIGPAGAPIQDLSGEKYGGPPLSINVGASYNASVFNGWGLEASFDTIYHSDGERVLNQPFTDVPSRTVTHIAATLFQQDGPMEIGLSCTNCFNEIYVTSIGNKPLAKINPGVNGDMTASIAPPRLVTLALTYNFNR